MVSLLRQVEQLDQFAQQPVFRSFEALSLDQLVAVVVELCPEVHLVPPDQFPLGASDLNRILPFPSLDLSCLQAPVELHCDLRFEG